MKLEDTFKDLVPDDWRIEPGSYRDVFILCAPRTNLCAGGGVTVHFGKARCFSMGYNTRDADGHVKFTGKAWKRLLVIASVKALKDGMQYFPAR